MKQTINFEEFEKDKETQVAELALMLKYINEIRRDIHEQIEYNGKNWKKLWQMLDTNAIRIEDYNMFTDTINKINIMYDDVCLLLLRMRMDTEDKLECIRK